MVNGLLDDGFLSHWYAPNNSNRQMTASHLRVEKCIYGGRPQPFHELFADLDLSVDRLANDQVVLDGYWRSA